MSEPNKTLHATFDRKMQAIEERRALQKQGKTVELHRLLSGRWAVVIVRSKP